MCQITIIAAVSKNDIIGNGNAIPWKLPTDLQNFRRLTNGGVVVMGRKTYESIGKP
jgi:dihydrofolate reductase